jgi:hypothetical protein
MSNHWPAANQKRLAAERFADQVERHAFTVLRAENLSDEDKARFGFPADWTPKPPKPPKPTKPKRDLTVEQREARRASWRAADRRRRTKARA